MHTNTQINEFNTKYVHITVKERKGLAFFTLFGYNKTLKSALRFFVHSLNFLVWERSYSVIFQFIKEKKNNNRRKIKIKKFLHVFVSFVNSILFVFFFFKYFLIKANGIMCLHWNGDCYVAYFIILNAKVHKLCI